MTAAAPVGPTTLVDRPGGPDGAPGALLSVLDVHLSFGLTRALNGASVEVGEREVVALVGPSGSGKSTLLHCAAGMLTPERGEVRYRSRRVDDLPDADRSRLRREEFGFVFQFGSLVPELTARENVALPLRLLGLRRRPAEARAGEWLERLGVGDLGNRRPGAMSGGQGQRVAVARALVAGPRVLFADEPTGALDQANGAVVADALVGMAREQGTAVVLVTHDPAVAARADRQVVLRDGRVDPAAVQR